MTADTTPEDTAARLAQIRDRNQRLANVPWNRHGGTGTPSCIPCELVRAIDDVAWLLERLDVALRSATDTTTKFATEMERLRKNDPTGAQWLESILAAPAEQQPENDNTTCAFPDCGHPDHQLKCGAMASRVDFGGSAAPCALPGGHDGDHATADGTVRWARRSKDGDRGCRHPGLGQPQPHRRAAVGDVGRIPTTAAEREATVSRRPIRIWKTPFQRAQHLDKNTYLGFDTIRRWRWRCYICDLGCTYPAATLASIYDAALEHLTDEHPARQS